MLLLALLALLACRTPDPDADALWDEIQGYDTWDQVPSWTGARPSCDGAHGDYVQIWHDAAAASLASGTAVTAEDGATIVKEGYADDGTTVRYVAVMQKRPGFDPDHGDWYWAEYLAGGSAAYSGSEPLCYNCHDEGTDYVWFLSSPVVDSLDECP